jgi:hypothetical protein
MHDCRTHQSITAEITWRHDDESRVRATDSEIHTIIFLFSWKLYRRNSILFSSFSWPTICSEPNKWTQEGQCRSHLNWFLIYYILLQITKPCYCISQWQICCPKQKVWQYCTKIFWLTYNRPSCLLPLFSFVAWKIEHNVIMYGDDVFLIEHKRFE